MRLGLDQSAWVRLLAIPTAWFPVLVKVFLILCASVPIPPKLVHPNSSSHAGNYELIVAFPCCLQKCWNIDHYIKGTRIFPIPVTEESNPEDPTQYTTLCKCIYFGIPS